METSNKSFEIEDYWLETSETLFNENGLKELYEKIMTESDTKTRIVDRFQKDNNEFMNPSTYILSSTVKIIEDSMKSFKESAYESGASIHQAVFESAYILKEFTHLPDYPEDQPLEMDYYDLGEKRKSLTEERIDNLFTYHLRSAIGFSNVRANYERITKMIASVKALINDPEVRDQLNPETTGPLIDTLVESYLVGIYDNELKPSMLTLRKEYASFMKMTSMLIALGKEKGYRVPEGWMEF